MSLSKIIDHTFLKPNCTKEDIARVCQEALQHNFNTVCVPPYFVKDAVRHLEYKMVKVATVIGFPMGYATTAAKVEEIKRAINDGADELDVVINLCAAKCGDWNYIKSDIDSITRAVHLKGKSIKIILETGLLTAAEISKICEICAENEVNYIKTSTGFHSEAVTPEIVAYLRSILPKSIKIKAAGGIRTAQSAQQLVDAGANRIGSSAGIDIINGI